jgi:hypothetical protein
MNGYAEERQGRGVNVPGRTCVVMQEREGDREGDMMFREEHA